MASSKIATIAVHAGAPEGPNAPITTPIVQSTTFRSFEFYFVATGLYLAMALGFRAGLTSIYWVVFQRGRAASR